LQEQLLAGLKSLPMLHFWCVATSSLRKCHIVYRLHLGLRTLCELFCYTCCININLHPIAGDQRVYLEGKVAEAEKALEESDFRHVEMLKDLETSQQSYEREAEKHQNEFGPWALVLGLLVLGLWSLGFDPWALVFGLWSLGFGSWALVLGLLVLGL
ncbi:hypothetical protein SARC_12605, partial [Sphaeroforma arctica JP610]